ncbi:MAG: MerR family transcriptional regulator [Deltaproteobacteria bacterium]|nr:MerR family transcriptional regulator [Deltaproteobacteria bacterium]
MSDDIPIPPDLPDKLYFRIGEVATLLGVEPHVLRYWEGEFGIRPVRSMSGQRLYRKQDIARFLKIRHLLHEKGFTVAGARKLLKEGGQPAPGISADVVRDAMDRIAEMRSRIAGLKDDTGPLWG